MNKKVNVAVVMMTVFMFVALPFGVQPASANSPVAAGSLIKGKSNSSVYYVGEDNKRYVFPNTRIYFSWHDDFNQVQTINDADLANYALGGNVQYKPGVNLVKVQTDPKVYAVSERGLLRWIKSEQLARLLYGANWNLLVDDIPDSFFFNYHIGDPINDVNGYDADDEEQEITSISENLGLKLKKQIAKIIKQEQKRTCDRLEKAVSKIQKRMKHYGIKADNLGSDLLEQCAEDRADKKVAICHIPPGNASASSTIIIGKAAATAHLAHGDTLGVCNAPTPSTDTTAPVISSIISTVSTSSAAITWNTNEVSDSKVEYSTVSPLGSSTVLSVINSSDVTSHSINLPSLTASTTYYFRITSVDPSNNIATSSEQNFITAALPVVDATAPVISGVGTTIRATSTTFVWTTNEPSTSEVTFATSSLSSAVSPSSVINSALVTNHSLDATGLTASTTYYFMLKSVDAASNLATTTEASFVTAGL